jgi:hypothetical protein
MVDLLCSTCSAFVLASAERESRGFFWMFGINSAQCVYLGILRLP